MSVPITIPATGPDPRPWAHSLTSLRESNAMYQRRWAPTRDEALSKARHKPTPR